MADQTNISNFQSAKDVSDAKTKKKNQVKAYMDWEMVNPDGTRILKADGTPVLRSDKDIALWGNSGQYKSKADEQLILGALEKDKTGEFLELTLKVRIKAYTPAPEIDTDDLFKAMGIIKTA